MNPFDAAELLMDQLRVSDAGLDCNPYRMDELVGRFMDSQRVPRSEIKEAFLSLWEDPYNWFFEDLYTDRAVEILYGSIRQFAAMEPAVEVNLPSIKELFPNGD